ncbi:MAG: DUF86 domain-containing protein [Thermoplasmatales archaeon]|nr:DUF86 domain-containing protein [Thermoplasmatales archaeon]
MKEERKRILNKLNEMINYIEELKLMLPSKEGYMNDLIKRRACEKTIEIAIEAMIDVGALIVSAEKLGFLLKKKTFLIYYIKTKFWIKTCVKKQRK